MGYNGMVAGIDESKILGDERQQSPEFQKYGYVVHSEANAIMHASRSLKERVYVTLFPVMNAQNLLPQKIKEVIYLNDKYRDTENNRIARKIFDLAGINYKSLFQNKKY